MRYFVTLLLAGMCAAVMAAPAMANDARIAGAKQCTGYIPSYERQYGIPSHLLSAISSTESGRYHDQLKILLPWPWTINVEGKGYYFDTKAQAITAVRQHQAAGRRSIDIGCMQVNLIHHADAFSSLEEAFDPKYNVQYAASFLRRLYESEKSWRKAAAAYHSKTPERGSKYVARVFRAWETIVSRLRLPKADTIKRADVGYDGRDLVADESSKRVKLSRASKNTLPKHETQSMKVIKVTDTEKNAPGNIVMIRPDVAEQSVNKAYKANASVTRVDRPTGQASSEYTNVIRLDNKPLAAEVEMAAAEKPVAQKSGPRFIFTE